MRFGRTTETLAKRMLKYDRLSWWKGTWDNYLDESANSVSEGLRQRLRLTDSCIGRDAGANVCTLFHAAIHKRVPQQR